MEIDMEETTQTKKNNAVKEFLLDIVRGMAIGIAFIIPGFSGGSIAAVLGIYEKLVGAVTDVFKSFTKSVITLLPIMIGMAIGVVSLMYPLTWALEAFPFPTVCLFVGLTFGALPSITDKLHGGSKATNSFALAIPLILALTLSFLPIVEDVDLFSLNFGGYVLLFVIGIVASAALVVPGISGSMLLLILGYYNPILKLATQHLLKGKDIGTSLTVLSVAGVGIVIGFVAISFLMKYLLRKYPCGTYFAILGFILGSIPTVYISTSKEAGYTLSTLPSNPLHWVMCVVMLAVGIAGPLLLMFYTKRKHNS